MVPLLFKAAALQWLCVPLAQQAASCSACSSLLDKFGDHALVCPNWGDRTKRHNHLRNGVYSLAAGAGLSPELDKPGLLLQPRPSIGPLLENGLFPASGRRPADVYLPRWRGGFPVFLDLAVTSGLRDTAASAQDASSYPTAYEDHKCSNLATKTLYNSASLSFVPLVAEAVGGAWGPCSARSSLSSPSLRHAFCGVSRRSAK